MLNVFVPLIQKFFKSLTVPLELRLMFPLAVDEYYPLNAGEGLEFIDRAFKPDQSPKTIFFPNRRQLLLYLIIELFKPLK